MFFQIILCKDLLNKVRTDIRGNIVNQILMARISNLCVPAFPLSYIPYALVNIPRMRV